MRKEAPKHVKTLSKTCRRKSRAVACGSTAAELALITYVELRLQLTLLISPAPSPALKAPGSRLHSHSPRTQRATYTTPPPFCIRTQSPHTRPGRLRLPYKSVDSLRRQSPQHKLQTQHRPHQPTPRGHPETPPFSKLPRNHDDRRRIQVKELQ
jgi:hypothetical protein